ncbi:MAG: 3-phosphoserine/phosphohydroxythreonine transaminase [Pirellulales bacterium]
MTERIFNFSAGPAVLPEPALAEAQRDLMALPGVGASVLEISHRSATFKKILEQTLDDLRSLLAIPDGYHVLFLQGGSRLQFSMVPMNLLRGSGRSADYLLTGSWGNKAIAEARKEGDVRVAWDGKASNYDRLPQPDALDLDPQAAYVHFTSNETIQGVQFPREPDVGSVPLVCDASSDFLSRPLAIDRYGILYACAQKNAGPAGVTVVIVREDLLAAVPDPLPGMLDYRLHVQHGSLYNTPPVFGIYFVGLIAKWLRHDVGGLDAMAEQNGRKAEWLYTVIDQSNGFYRGHAQPECRSVMNVTFRLPSELLEKEFLEQAQSEGLVALGGHRSVGGIRASIYNAMPETGVKKLRDFMQAFHRQHAG